MKEIWNEFTKEMKIAIIYGIIIGGIILFTSIYIMHEASKQSGSVNYQPAKMYEVMNENEDGYYIAVQVKYKNGERYIPASYVERDDKVVAYHIDEVVGTVPQEGDLVQIRIERNGIDLQVKRYDQ